MEIDPQLLCLTFAFTLPSFTEYVRYRQKPDLKEQFHHAQIGLLSSVRSLAVTLTDPDLEALRLRSLRYLRASDAAGFALVQVEARFFILEQSVSKPKPFAEYLRHPLADFSA